MYLETKPLYPFGYGLSYTTFDYKNLKLNTTEIHKADSVRLTLSIKNTGKMDGDEVVQVYAHQEKSAIKMPIKQLVAFRRVNLKVNEAKELEFSVPASALRYWDETIHDWKVDAGRYDLMIGSSSNQIKLSSKFQIKN